ncbi:ATP synthase subunit B family protein [Micromonospora zhanjiangensis]|uniref:ATPase n=1 Tax=Micromonospora zhanjiangensis TaxID=1522057 RepID=A0ABV8KT57_9ACTN
MNFPVVGIGYDEGAVDSCLNSLGERLVRLAARSDVDARVRVELDSLRRDLDRLRGLLRDRADAPAGATTSVADPAGELDVARRQAVRILARARHTLSAAQAEARQVRDRAYSEAMQARRDFEAALYARRQREIRADEILRHVRIEDLLDESPAGVRTPAQLA